MLLRLEVLGRVLHLELSKLEAAEAEPEKPVDVPQPMVTYAEPPADPVGFRLQSGEGHAGTS